ncbi:glutamine-rich protein 2-like isoform X3 [Scyliorhinus torazame]
MSLMEEMVQEINNLKNFQSTVEDRISDIDKNINMVSTDINLINDLLNDTQKSQQFVSWNTLQNTLLDSSDDDFSRRIERSANIVQAPGSEAKVSGGPQEEASETLPKKKKPVPAPVKVSEEAPPLLKYKPFEKSEIEMPDLTSFLATDPGAQLHPEVIHILQHIRHMANSQPALVQRVSVLEKALSDLESGQTDQHGVQTPDDADDLKSGDMKEQVSSLRNMVKKIDEELKEMRSFQDTCGKGGGRIQQQLNKLGPVLEKIMSSSCALLGMSLGLEVEATCPVCSLDVSQDASNLCQRFQKLQGTVNTLVDSTGDIAKDLELQSQLQDNILQLQGECERLNQTTSQLLQGDQLHQKNIEALTDSISRLERKCIEETVSRCQFDAVTEQINKMIQGLMKKICIQEKDWGCILERLSEGMDHKLDRVELEPLKKQLEERWRAIRKQLMKNKDIGQEGAAALKKQLISHFHCLSCDRPMDIKLPSGPNVLSFAIPSTPAPGYRSNRYDADDSRRRSKGQRTSRARMEKNITCMQRLHINLCRQIARVQSHFKGSIKAVSPFMRPLLHIGCPASSPPRRVFERIIKSERISELIENFPVNVRSCGGSHTLTYGYHRRGTKGYDHHPTQMMDENLGTKQWGDTVVTRTDTQPPKGRVNCKLPSIGGKDVTKCKPITNSSRKSSSSKLSSCQSYCAFLPSLAQPGSVMPNGSLSSELDCQCFTNLTPLCPCIDNQMSAEEPSLSCPLGKAATGNSAQPEESLGI